MSFGIVIPNKKENKEWCYQCVIDVSDQSHDFTSLTSRHKIEHIFFEITIYFEFPQIRKSVQYRRVTFSNSLTFDNLFKLDKKSVDILYYRKDYWIDYFVKAKCKREFSSIDVNTNVNSHDEKCTISMIMQIMSNVTA